MPDPTGYDRTLGALEDLVDRCAARGDRIGYFAAMYVAVTETIRQRAAEGRFEDVPRMERFVNGFATRFLDAEKAWRDSAPCAESWQAAFRAAGRWRPIVLQHLLLGMNAHINLDLGVTASGLDDGGSIDAVRADFDAVQDVLGELVDGCQAALGTVSPWLGLADRIGGGSDETMIRFSLAAARRQAWSVAVRLSALSGGERDHAIVAVDAATVRIARVVEHPGILASALLLAVRVRERAKPRRSCSCSPRCARRADAGGEPDETMCRTCAHPGCTVRFADCEIHHVIDWDHHGPTNLANRRPDQRGSMSSMRLPNGSST